MWLRLAPLCQEASGDAQVCDSTHPRRASQSPWEDTVVSPKHRYKLCAPGCMRLCQYSPRRRRGWAHVCSGSEHQPLPTTVYSIHWAPRIGWDHELGSLAILVGNSHGNVSATVLLYSTFFSPERKRKAVTVSFFSLQS